MMNYNNYDYIDDEEFLEIEKRLVPIERMMIHRLVLSGWKLTRPVKDNDALIVDFSLDDELFMGNIGLVCIEATDGVSFSLYVTKSYDELNNKYFVKHFISENESLSFYEQNIDLIVDKAIQLYESWDTRYIFDNNISY